VRTLDAINRLLSKAGLRLERTKTICAPSLRPAHEVEGSSSEGEKDDMQEHDAVPHAQSQGKREAAKEAHAAAPIPAAVPPSSPVHEGTAPDAESPRGVASGAELPATPTVPALTPPPIPAHEELARIRQEMPAIFERTARCVATGELGLIGWGLTLPRVQKLAQEHDEKPWFFMGDIHGDFLALHRLIERVRQERNFRLCFLGDLIDRGLFSIECFAYLLEAVERHPSQILWIMGNHDVGVWWHRTQGKFVSSVEEGPGVEAKFPEFLNADSGDTDMRRTWGLLFIDVVSRLPRAVLFRDGLLATHGGVPLNDRWQYLKTLEAFHHIRCLEDFTFTRMVNYPRRVGYMKKERAFSSDMGLGYKDLEDFCQTVKSLFPVSRVICGHEHVDNGYERPGCFKNVPVLKINGFGFYKDLRDGSAKYRNLVLGVSQQGQLPTIAEVQFSQEEHAQLYCGSVKQEVRASLGADGVNEGGAIATCASPISVADKRDESKGRGTDA